MTYRDKARRWEDQQLDRYLASLEEDEDEDEETEEG